MIFRTLDSNGDFTFGKGLNNYATDNKAIGLNIQTRIKSWLGDCFFALNEGIDWYNRLGKKNQRPLLEQDLRRVVLQSFGVIGILEFSTDLTDRNLQVSYEVDTIFTGRLSDTVALLTDEKVYISTESGDNLITEDGDNIILE
jgi:hypothetical protein